MRKKESTKMVLEVYQDGLVIGYVVGSDRLDAYALARKYFPDCSNVRSGHLPIHDVRCVKVNDNVYTWSITK